ncbi:unnamed protein product [Linum trigynum]|uniref:Uncharacterized protein n=1 Tax=Linum trigynum TaxID=586398 RepID=A0AAV2ED25_9ROSI
MVLANRVSIGVASSAVVRLQDSTLVETRVNESNFQRIYAQNGIVAVAAKPLVVERIDKDENIREVVSVEDGSVEEGYLNLRNQEGALDHQS